jgi:signal transduction histidine kinase
MKRAEQLFEDQRRQMCTGTDRLFLWLFVAQWLFALGLAWTTTPYSWNGTRHVVHFHVLLALGFGPVLNALPIALIVLRPGWWGTRHVIAVVQMMWSAMLIMITGGRIETHFHIFGSLAFLAFYRDWKVVVTATVAVLADHLVRGLLWPDSVYGVANPEWWRFLEHTGWIAFEDVVLVVRCRQALGEMRNAAEREAELETTNADVEHLVERRTSELKDALQRYRALVETTAAIPWEYEPATRRFPYISPQGVHLLECDVADLADPKFQYNMVHDDDRGRVIGEIERFVAGGCRGNEAIDYRLVTKTSRTAYVRSFLSSTDGKVVRGVTLDLTKQRQLELELQQAQKLESVGRLAAGVAHEINTPVQFVSDSVRFVRDGMADLGGIVELHRQLIRSVLSGQPAKDVARQIAAADAEIDFGYLFQEFPSALDRALDGLARVTQIVRSMKTFARSDTATMTTVDLNAAVESTLTIARSEYKYVADLVTELGPLPPVTCHAGEINQVILNIVINAAHAIAERNVSGDERGTIAVSTREDGDNALIAIRDTGNGIAEHVRDRIFDPFFTTKAVGRGTGQGLAISRNVVVDKHHGTLTFDTELGHGTTFYIRIPIAGHATTLAA